MIKAGVNSKCAFAFRLTLSCIITFTGVAYPFFKWYADSKFSGKELLWNPSQDAYILHVISAAGEWAACLCLPLYAMSFYTEFQVFSIQVCGIENNV